MSNPSPPLHHAVRALRGALLLACATTFAIAQAPVTTVGAVRELTPDQARAGQPVVLHGVVTTLSGWKNSFFFADKTAGISIDRTTQAPVTHQGDEVEVHGHTDAGLFAPLVIADSINVLGKAPLPAAKIYSAADLSGGDKDSQWIAVRGIIRTAEIKQVWGSQRLVLSVDVGAGSLISATVQEFDPAKVASLPAATVLLRGVCGTVFNDRRQFIGVRLFVASLADITIERPAPSEPFNMPERQLNALLRFADGKDQSSQVKVSGVVTWARAGQGIYLQDGSQGVFVQSGSADKAPLDARVEAVGYPALGSYSPQLENAIFRVHGTGDPVKPIDVNAAEVIAVKDGFASGPYDSLLVRVKGKLLESIPSGDERVLLLQDGTTVFTARIARGTLSKMRLDNGSVLQLTGICAITADATHEPKSFAVLLRSRDDVTVLKGAPWWTAKHASWIAAALAVIALVMFGIVQFLRRQARLQELVVADPLTGLYNRRGFLAFAQDRWQTAQKQGSTLVLFYIDLDKFKEINDTFGHKMGDLALQRVAGMLRESFRKADVVGRMGGDEFAVVALDSGDESRTALEDRLQSAVKQTNEKQRFAFEIQLSIGVVVCEGTKSGATIESLLAEADTVMYEQKRRRKAAR